MAISSYFVTGTTSSSSTIAIPNYAGGYSISGTAIYENNCIGTRIESGGGIAPQLYFKFIKSKFKMLERMALDRRLKKIEKAFDKAVAAGQEALSKKLLESVVKEARESAIYAKGIRHFVEREDVQKHKRKIKGGHISDTKFKDYVRVIPPAIIKKKQAVECVFDDFIIYHYWDEKAEDVKAMTPEIKEKMKDPVLFGIIRETDRLYFIGDWEDEYCDLTFDEMVGVIGRDEEETTLTKYPEEIYHDDAG